MSDTILFRYHGAANAYVDIATRGDERLGLGLFYYPVTGSIIARFVVHSTTGAFGEFKHFWPREKAEFLPLEKTAHMTAIEGVRLNKFEINVFNKPVSPVHLEVLGDALSMTGVGASLWLQVAAWIEQQAAADGFTVNVDLPSVVKTELIPPVPDGVVMAPAFPDLALYRAKRQGIKSKPVVVMDDDDEDNEDDEPGETVN
jgi:hypothetical protein